MPDLCARPHISDRDRLSEQKAFPSGLPTCHVENGRGFSSGTRDVVFPLHRCCWSSRHGMDQVCVVFLVSCHLQEENGLRGLIPLISRLFCMFCFCVQTLVPQSNATLDAAVIQMRHCAQRQNSDCATEVNTPPTPQPRQKLFLSRSNMFSRCICTCLHSKTQRRRGTHEFNLPGARKKINNIETIFTAVEFQSCSLHVKTRCLQGDTPRSLQQDV